MQYSGRLLPGWNLRCRGSSTDLLSFHATLVLDQPLLTVSDSSKAKEEEEIDIAVNSF